MTRILDEGPVLVTKLVREFGASPATGFRWCVRGRNGIYLESILIGARRWSSRPAMERFIAALNKDNPTPPTSPAAADASREAEVSRAESQLAAIGV